MKLPFWGTILTILGIAVLCGLGTWQLQRLAWKENMLSRIEAQKNDFRKFTPDELTLQNEYAQGEVEGHILYDAEIAIGPRTSNGVSGYHIITPLLLTDGHTILINRGWVPLDYKLETRADDQEDISVAGMIRVPDKGNWFTPENNPAKDQWYSFRPDEIAGAKHLNNVLPVVLYEIDLLDGGHGTFYPDPNALMLDIPNNHLQYACFWFSMAFAMAAIYALRFLVRKK